ncbi:single-stranded-DNA-specific exonuclease RecJ [Providencia huaxiensis]|uniref:Single-stranded-DNA-specific exonuclease RecJ n=1 Tax=Providencia huaxiensis TaxID=2027290 RepID=A0A345M2Q9_9GAMM|nr:MULTISPECIES: single-stranded-DNA-specific exonuclease RecJ [Providencia]MBZ3681559.1 single-stranded-DNA-specific exonuclease RecJ [Providencia rettgeri]AXH64649.1 single-stranded-DNA-specific exonuclease RecJ [Providencia huaxiensis]MBN6361101.1 single-stranded-DNA-specific exonuclease RecJ [Providencia huaxiensis]MBQ0269168.1 single-stranded-DNA-specific exonuclease RecJ [Providencia huaxiensis]MCD2530185.1 single-stranded-DNA-specific exonuclease RecJ [Providencia huaxiensis]
MNVETLLQQRQQQSSAAQLPGLPELLQRIYQHRGVTDITQLERKAANLLDYRTLSGIDKALPLLYRALNEHEAITIVGDFDADGATSTALAIRALKSMGYRNINYIVPNRFENGYGLTPLVVEEARNQGTNLIITVDNGISSHEGVEVASHYGINVIITDHHLPGETLPAADAIINPNLNECGFASKSLAGVGVTFYLMSALRAYLRQQGWFVQQGVAEPNLAEYLDLVALGTVADVVPLDVNNRILVHQGLNRVRAGRCCAGIKALVEVSKRDLSRLVANDFGFALGPRLNAAGRLDDMSVSIELLLTDDMAYARELANELDGLNQTRREIEAGMQQEALVLFNQFEYGENQLPNGLAIYHPEWHQGVVGILASRIKEQYHRPVIAFAPAGDGLLKGSGRSIQGVHMRDALERLNTLQPGLMQKFGGHAMAAGLTLEVDKFDAFKHHFELLMGELIQPEQLAGVIWSDGELSRNEFCLETAELIRESGPWGQSFPEPVFDGEFQLLQQRLVGERHLKLMLEPVNGGPMLDAIMFNIDVRRWPDNSIKKAKIAFKLDVNEFRGQKNVQLMIEHIWPD